MKTLTQNYFSTIIYAVLLLIFTTNLNASTPAEMAEFSLQELLAMSTDEDSSEIIGNNPWSLTILYSKLKLDGYLDGSKNLSNSEVQFQPGDTRTNKNFPIIPTTITQEALIANIKYRLSNTSNVSFSLPYIKQSTNHESIKAGYEAFNITSEGLGDVTINYSQLVKSWNKQQITYSVGLSAPTGSIDQKGDTPKAPGDQQLPYTMQLGSGTWDIPAGLHYQKQESDWIWGANILAKLRMGNNDRNYRLGNRFSISVWGKWLTESSFRPIVNMAYRHWNQIHGRDDEIILPGNFPYPASITNPANFGGEKINITLGGEIGGKKQFFVIKIGAPIYQSLNGIQNKEALNINTSWSFTF